MTSEVLRHDVKPYKENATFRSLLRSLFSHSSGQWLRTFWAVLHQVLPVCRSSNSTNISARFNGEEKSFRHVARVEKSLDLDKPWSWKYGRKKTKTLTWRLAWWLLSGTKLYAILFFHRSTTQIAISDKKDCCEIKKFATTVTWRHTSPSLLHFPHSFALIIDGWNQSLFRGDDSDGNVLQSGP